MVNKVSAVNGKHPLDMSHIKLTYIAPFYCNQSSIEPVVSLLKKYETYPADLTQQIEFVIVDDGSPIDYEIPQYSLNITWLRINEDIQWNQCGARNFGVTYAKSDKIIMTDIDHEFPPHTLQYLIDLPHPGRRIYKFFRIDNENQSPMRRHANTFFLSRARFMRHFGYDEEFAGNYGDEDYQLTRHHRYHGAKICDLPEKYLCYKRVLDLKNSYHSLIRDRSKNILLVERKKREMALFGAEHGHSRLFLNFTWTIMYRNHTDVPVQPIRRYWRFFWRLRRLFATW